jgi:hypothetical protein
LVAAAWNQEQVRFVSFSDIFLTCNIFFLQHQKLYTSCFREYYFLQDINRPENQVEKRGVIGIDWIITFKSI